MPKPTEYDKTHLRNMAAIGTRIDRIFKRAAEEAAKIGVSIKKTLPEDRIFSFDDYPETRKQIERLMTALQESMETTIVSGVRSAWTLSNNKNNALVSRIFGDRVGDLSKEQYRRYFSTNGTALDAFLQRKEQGLNLSDRVWRYTNAFKHEIELGLDLGIRTGESAASMTRSLRQYLQHPDKLFRRVRDKHGNLRLSKAAQEFHPGRGVYRSSYKNARRLACTETNMAYHTSDHLRWQQMDFVVGIEIKLSNNHTLNGVPLTDICDELKGRYPKDFKFVGWHPHCRCHVVTVLKTEEEMQQDTQRILAGEKPERGSVNAVRDVPAAFKDWVSEHSDRIEMGGNLPYFVRDNKRRVDSILGIATEPQKTPLEIAAERHVNRKPEEVIDIQQRWNETRLRNLAAAIDDGYLPKEIKERLEEMLANNNPEHFEEINSRIAFYQKRAKKHMERDPKDIADIKERWAQKQQRDKHTRLMADNVLKLRSEYPNDVDFSVLEKLIADNNLTKMREEAKRVAQAIKAIRDEEKALADLIPDAHGWHKSFSLSELREAHGKIQSTLDYWKAKGYDLATDSNLDILKKELEQKIKFVENPGAFKAGLKAHKTWQVQKQAYEDLLGKVETRIETIKLEADYQALLGFKTTSKDFKEFMAKAKAAIDAGDVKTAKSYLASAEWKKNDLEAKRKGKSSGSGTTSAQFGNDAYTKARRDAAMWAQDTEEADKRLRTKCGEVWKGATKAEKDAIYGYTGSYCNINEPLRGLTYTGRPQKRLQGLRRIPHIESIIDRSSYDFDMWLQRGDGMVALKKFGLTNWSNPTDADIMALLGAEGVEGAFWSAGVAKGKGFSGDIIFNIYAPKGTKAMYCEPFSAYGNGSGRSWNGISEQSSYGHESEILIQRGTKFKITKIEKSGGQWFIDVDIIEQHPVTFPYVGGYPFK